MRQKRPPVRQANNHEAQVAIPSLLATNLYPITGAQQIR